MKLTGELLRMPYRAKLVAEVVKEVCSGKEVSLLDVGCGDGRLLANLISLLPQYKLSITALDTNDSCVEEAKRVLPKGANVFVADFETYEDLGYYDLVTMCGVIENFEHPVKALKKAKSLADFVFVLTPNCKSIHRYVLRDLGKIEKVDTLTKKDLKFGHKRLYTLKKLAISFRQAGLSILKFGGLMLKPVEDAKLVKLKPETIKLLCYLGKFMPDYCSEIWIVGKSEL